MQKNNKEYPRADSRPGGPILRGGFAVIIFRLDPADRIRRWNMNVGEQLAAPAIMDPTTGRRGRQPLQGELAESCHFEPVNKLVRNLFLNKQIPHR